MTKQQMIEKTMPLTLDKETLQAIDALRAEGFSSISALCRKFLIQKAAEITTRKKG